MIRRGGLQVWYDLLAAEVHARLVDSGTHHAREIARITRERRAAGEIDSLETLRAELLLAHALHDSLAAYGDRKVLLTRAARAIGSESIEPLFNEEGPTVEVGKRSDLIDSILGFDPILERLRAEETLARAEEGASAAERKPTFGFGLGVASIEQQWGYLNGEIRIGLPVGRWGDDPATEAYAFERNALELEMRERERELRALVAVDLQEIEDRRKRLEQYDRSIIPLLRESWRVALILYREGATGYLNVVDAHEALRLGEIERMELAIEVRKLTDQLLLLGGAL